MEEGTIRRRQRGKRVREHKGERQEKETSDKKKATQGTRPLSVSLNFLRISYASCVL